MCRVRVIFKSKEERILKDQVYQFDNLKISPIDRPSYVICITDGNRFDLQSFFISDDESFRDVIVDENVRFLYGNLSGRIKRLETSHYRIHSTAMFRCKQALPTELSIRVKNNINEYLQLYDLILGKLDNSTTYVEEELNADD